MHGREQRAASGHCNTQTHLMHISRMSFLESLRMYCEVVSLLQDFAGDVHLIMSVAMEAHFGYPMPNIAL